MADGFFGMVEVGGHRYMAASQSEGQADVEARIGRQQKAAEKVLSTLMATALEYDITPENVLSELQFQLENKKG